MPSGRCSLDIPSFTAVYVREILEYSLYSKDLTLARQVLPVLYQIVDHFSARIDETGLIPLYRGKEMWNFYEWREGLDGRERFSCEDSKVYEAPLAAFVCDAMKCFARLLDLLEVPGSSKYAAMAEKLGAAAHKAFFDEQAGAYVTRLGDPLPRHALTQALMLFADIVPDAYRETVKSVLVQDSLIHASVSMTIYVYEALLRDGNAYREYVLDDMAGIWGKMLCAGEDTFWETDEGANTFGRAGSLCHGWSAVPIYILGRYFNDLK